MSLVPDRYRAVSVLDVDVPLEAGALHALLTSRPVYRRTRYVVVRGGGETALVEVRRQVAPDQRVRDATAVSELHHERSGLGPDVQLAPPTPVDDAVRGDLVRGEDHVPGSVLGQPRLERPRPHEATQPAQVAVREDDPVGRLGRRRQRRGEPGLRMMMPAVLDVRAACRTDHRMGPHRVRDDLGGERVHVVGAHQPPRRTVVERHVQQRLVQVALLDLDVAATGPDRFADATHRPQARRAVDEASPHREDPPRVPTELPDVEELDPVGVRPQR